MTTRQRGGYNNNSQLSPMPLTGEIPTMFPSNEAKIGGHGCAGTRLASAAAKGKYVPYQSGGGVCLSENPGIGGVTGPTSGHSAVKPCGNMVRTRDLALGAGNVAEVGRKASLSGGRRRKSRSSKTRRHKRKTRGHKRKTRGRKRKTRVRKRKTRGRKHKSRGRKHKSRGRKHRGRRSRRQRGGYHQVLTDIPYSQGYQAAGIKLGPKQSALASPVPHTAYAKCPNNF